MKNLIISFALGILLCVMASCERQSNSFYQEFLDEAELAKPGKVDSLRIFPGHYRAQIRFRVSPDKRINRVKIRYSTALSSETSELNLDISADEHGRFKLVDVDEIPESTLLVNAIAFSNGGDSSNVVSANARIYGSRYISTLNNRIFSSFSLVNGVRQINFAAERLPTDQTLFRVMQYTELEYPTTTGEIRSITFTPYQLGVPLPNLRSNGTLRYRTLYKPESTAIDLFQGSWTSRSF